MPNTAISGSIAKATDMMCFNIRILLMDGRRWRFAGLGRGRNAPGLGEGG
jgi:hypothetical protein